MSSEFAIEVRDLRYRYGRHPALEGLDFRVPRGATYGLLGPNGSGKSTTIRLLLGLLKYRQGSIRVLGMDPKRQPLEVKQAIGYVAEEQSFYPWMRVGELLDFVAHYRPSWDSDYAQHLAGVLGVDRGPRISELSKGQKAMVSLLSALAFRPSLLVFDEPTSALDPRARRRFLESVLSEYREDGGTILISSHLIGEIAGIVDHVGILEKGRMVESAAVESLQASVRCFRLTFAEGEPPSELDFPGLLHRSVHGRQLLVTVRSEVESEQVSGDGVPPALEALGASRIEAEALGLEEIFLELTGGAMALDGAGVGSTPDSGADAAEAS